MFYIAIIFIILISVFLFTKIKYNEINLDDKSTDFSIYKKKAFLFDSVSELNLYRILVKNFSDKYFIFSQVGYSHLIEPKKTDWKEERRYRSRIDRKSADFVLCDKDRVVPQVIIELDGPSHKSSKRMNRDLFIDNISNIAGIKIIHITTENMDENYLVSKINLEINNDEKNLK